MKRYITLFLVFFLLFSSLGTYVLAKSPEPEVSADSAVLMDASTGTILYSKNMDTAYPPASTTKIMTALLTLENVKLDDKVTVGKNPPSTEGSSIGIFEGEEISVKDLLYGMLLLSGNDCAEALAEYVGGTREEFVKLMNERAKQLGCTETNFVNPSGLYDDNHRTSAKDLSIILRELVKHPDFLQISSTYSYKIPATNKHPEGIPLGNENKLINKASMYYYQGADAGKTGYTVQSSHSYVASAMRDGQRLIVALVHDKDKRFFEDSRALFDYGFNNFQLVPLFKKNDLVTTYSEEGISIPLLAASDYYYVKNKASNEIPKFDIPKQQLGNKSFNKGDIILQADVTFDNKTLNKLELSSGIDHIIKPTLNEKIIAAEKGNKPAAYIGIFLFVSVLAIFCASIYRLRQKKKMFK